MDTGRRAVLAGGMISVMSPILGAARRPARAAEGIKLGIGFAPTDDFVPIMIAKERGLFAAARIDASITIIAVISNVPAAIMSKSIQIGSTTGPALLQAVEGGLDLVIVSGMSRLNKEHQLVSLLVSKQSGITKAGDLEGKRVAVPGLNSLLDLLLRRWMAQNGVNPKSVTLIETSFPAMGDMLRNGTVDAAILKEPARSSALKSDAGMRLVDYPFEVRPDILNTFWIAERSWAMANPAAIQGFRAGLAAGIAEFERDPEGGHAIEQKYYKSPGGLMPFFSATVTPADIEFMRELSQQFGLVEGKFDARTLILP